MNQQKKTDTFLLLNKFGSCNEIELYWLGKRLIQQYGAGTMKLSMQNGINRTEQGKL